MKIKLLLFFLFCFACFLKVKAQADIIIPEAETHSTNAIASFIQTNYKTDKERLAAAYSWVTSNIRYDTDSMYAINSGGNPEARISIALKRRRGVCENFAAILNDIAVKCGIRSFEVKGYTKQAGSIDKAAHTWCVVNLDKEWLCCDPTWDVGFTRQTRYFLQQPAVFIEPHMPFDPLWQLMDEPITHNDFFSGRHHSKKEKNAGNFIDSLNAYLEMSELGQLESSVSRITRTGIANELARTNISYLQMEISMIYQDKNMNIYNAAVADFNKANTLINNFIRYRNDQFTPLRSDKDINEMLAPVDGIILSAYKKLDELDRLPANFQYNSESLRLRLENLAVSAYKQRQFVKRYLESPAPERPKLFYQ